jgi:hypothetical protein
LAKVKLRPRKKERELATLELIRKGILKGRQACKGAPWMIEAQALAAIKIGPRGRPVTSNQDQKTLQF